MCNVKRPARNVLACRVVWCSDPRCEGHSGAHTVPVDGFLFFATVAIYGVLVLLVTAPLTGRRLIATLMVALVPAVLLLLLLPDGSYVRSLGIPMTTGVTFAAAVRGVRGIDSPLRGAPAD